MKKTLVLGASPNPNRYAYTAVQRLVNAGYEVVPLGIKSGEISGLPIENGLPKIEEVDTVTIYLSKEKQKPYYDYILSLKPKRIIFNPGAENLEFAHMASVEGIEIDQACTLVMLAAATY